MAAVKAQAQAELVAGKAALKAKQYDEAIEKLANALQIMCVAARGLFRLGSRAERTRLASVLHALSAYCLSICAYYSRSEACVDTPMQLDLAPFYVEYGYALLTNAQQSNDVFGGAVKAAQQAKLGALTQRLSLLDLSLCSVITSECSF